MVARSSVVTPVASAKGAQSVVFRIMTSVDLATGKIRRLPSAAMQPSFT